MSPAAASQAAQQAEEALRKRLADEIARSERNPSAKPYPGSASRRVT